MSQEPIELEVGKEFSNERLSAGQYDLVAGKLRLEPYAGVVLEKLKRLRNKICNLQL